METASRDRAAVFVRLVPKATRSAWRRLTRIPTRRRVTTILHQAGVSWADFKTTTRAKVPQMGLPSQVAFGLELGKSLWEASGTEARITSFPDSARHCLVQWKDLEIVLRAEGDALVYVKSELVLLADQNAALLSVLLERPKQNRKKRKNKQQALVDILRLQAGLKRVLKST